MSDFRKLSAQVWASPQIGPDEVREAAAQGFALIINNRPDGEVPDQPGGDEIAAAAAAAGLAYLAIPVIPGGFTRAQAEATANALAEAGAGKVLAYCRTGTRSTLLWALARTLAGEPPQALAEAAAQAGYDLAPVRAAMEQLAATRD